MAPKLRTYCLIEELSQELKVSLSMVEAMFRFRRKEKEEEET